MVTFESQLEKMMFVEELKFEPTPGFEGFKRYLSHAIAHPAKMNTHLLRFLIERFTCEGDVVLDPMAGSGSTGVIASLHGRNAVCVELEEKFYGWMEQARVKVERQQILGGKGWIRNVCGDARKLSQLLKGVDAILTSPPYSGSITGNLPATERRAERMIAAGHNPKTILGGHARNAQIEWRYAKREDKANIGNLPHGNVDAVITSPPYAELFSARAGGRQGHNPTDKDVEMGFGERQTEYSKSKENIGNLPFQADAVITSPPYEDAMGKHHATSKLQKIKKDWGEYSTDKDNIGNLKKETYLEAMLKVYAEMYKVLKPNGKAIIVIKPFIRNKQVVDLPYHTWLLLQKAGFKLAGLFKLRLKQESFWRILYGKKYPNVPKIQHEYILVCQKEVA